MNGKKSATLGQFIALLSAGIVVAPGCGDGNVGGTSPRMGSLRATLQATTAHDVALVRYAIVAAGASCASSPLAEADVPLAAGTLPPAVQPDGGMSGADHAFADAFFTLAPGDYQVCVQPLNASFQPSDECQAAQAAATVVAGQTTEVVIVSQCSGGSSGGIDGVTVLNDPPRIDSIDIVPSAFIDVCQLASISVTASDPNGDTISYAWQVISAPPGAGVTLVPSDASATFTTNVGGDYQVQVTATDVHGAAASLSLPIHVIDDGTGGVPTACYTLTVEARGVGTVSSTAPPGGISCTGLVGGSDCTESYPANTAVTLAAVVEPHAAADGDVFFGGWLAPCPGGLAPTTTVTMDMNRTCVALFNPRFQLSLFGQGTVIVSPVFNPGSQNPGVVTCAPASLCRVILPVDQDVTLTAVPEPGFVFAGWRGSGTCEGLVSSSGNAATVRISVPSSCVATFNPQ